MRRLRGAGPLVRHLVQREFIVTYRRSALGILWSLLMPLTQLAVLVFVFGRIVPLGIERYPAFVFSALLPWSWFATCVGGSSMLFINNRDLVRRPDFSPALLVVVHTLANLVAYVIAVPILLGVLAWNGLAVGPALLFFPVLALVQAVLIAGACLLLATLNVFYRDVQHVTGVAVMFLFYLTPVFYRLPADAGGLAHILDLNPMAGLVNGYRAIFFYGTLPPLGPLALAAVVSVLTAALGYGVYRRSSHDLIDLL